MSEQAQQPMTGQRARRRRTLYRAVLSLAVAALLAAWLPFSVLYINALSNHAALLARGSPAIQLKAGQPVHAVTPITTRTS